MNLLTQLTATLTQLENASAGNTPAELERLDQASAQLAALTALLHERTHHPHPAEQAELKARLPALLGRMAALTTRLENARTESETQLQNLRSQTAALNAYLKPR